MNAPTSFQPARLQRGAFSLGAIALIASIIGGIFNPLYFFRGWLMGFLFVISLPLGALVLLLIYNLVGGQWAELIRNILSAMTRTLPIAALLFIPVILGIHYLYPWNWPEVASKFPPGKGTYLSTPFFIARAAFCFVVWFVFTALWHSWEKKKPRDCDSSNLKFTRVGSGWGLVLLGLTVTFASIDWVMSLDPRWYSTIYGMIFMVNQPLTALCTVILLVRIAQPAELVRVQEKPFLDLGNLLLMFILLWVYLAFMEFLIVWSGNLKEEIVWYLERGRGAWPFIAAALFVLHFLAPFFLLLARNNKRRLSVLSSIALVIWLSRFVDVFWHVGPLKLEGAPQIHWQYFVAPIALVSLWFGAFLTRLKKFEALIVVPSEEEVAA